MATGDFVRWRTATGSNTGIEAGTDRTGTRIIRADGSSIRTSSPLQVIAAAGTREARDQATRMSRRIQEIGVSQNDDRKLTASNELADIATGTPTARERAVENAQELARQQRASDLRDQAIRSQARDAAIQNQADRVAADIAARRGASPSTQAGTGNS